MIYIFLVASLLQLIGAVDVHFSQLVAEGAVTDFGISVKFKNSDNPKFVKYQSCHENDDCVGLNWDDDAVLQITMTVPDIKDINTVSQIGDLKLGKPVQFKIMACFETEFTVNRKWRKPKDIIQDDKRCTREVISKRILEDGNEPLEWTIPSTTPRGRYFLTLFVYCSVNGSDGDEYCGLDATQELTNLAKATDLANKGIADVPTFVTALSTSEKLSFKTTVIDSRPPQLIASVIVLSILSVSMLILYFVYERVLKKTV